MAHRIKDYSDFQIEWKRVIPHLKKGKCQIKTADFLSTPGDAPKNFIRIREYRPGHRTRQEKWTGYIAKVGHKFYPIESVTEHLLTRVGQAFGFVIADSKLLIVDKQVRFLSKFFLRRKETLIHGPQIFKRLLGDDEMVDEIANKRMESEFYTFQMVCEAIEYAYPHCHEQIMASFVEMLAFDAIVGHNDRHPSNWGVIEPISSYLVPRFSPIYDTARAMFWRMEESKVSRRLEDPSLVDTYIERSRVLIGWDHKKKISHFELINLIYKEFPIYRRNLTQFVVPSLLENGSSVIDTEFVNLMSTERRSLIRNCLAERHRRYCEAVQ